MTSPRLALDSPYGRLYCKPENREKLTGDFGADVESGLLVPSVTNVIGILEKPHLYDWYARKASEAALEVSSQHPGLISRKPHEAKRWLSGAAKRHTNAAADLGTRIHDLCERLASGEQDVPVAADEKPYVESWHQFNERFQPSYLHLEKTVFGESASAECTFGYAGTADFIAEIDGLTVVGDLKTGRSIHTEAALQLNALAFASELIGEDDAVTPTPQCHLGLVVHLAPKSFSVRMVPLADESMLVFTKLRELWGFHTENLISREALLMSGSLSTVSELRSELERYQEQREAG